MASTKKTKEDAVRSGIERAKLEKLSRQFQGEPPRVASNDHEHLSGWQNRRTSSDYQPLSDWQNTMLVPADVHSAVPSHLHRVASEAERFFFFLTALIQTYEVVS